MLTQKRINNIDLLLKKLAESSNRWMSLAIAIDLANEVMKGILPEKKIGIVVLLEMFKIQEIYQSLILWTLFQPKNNIHGLMNILIPDQHVQPLNIFMLKIVLLKVISIGFQKMRQNKKYQRLLNFYQIGKTLI